MIHVLLALALATTPSRAADQGCKWENLSDSKAGLQAWVERCDYGFRKVDLFIKGNQLFQRFSDGGEPDPLIDVFELKAGEAPEAGLKRIFAERTPKAIVKQCKLVPFADDAPRAGVKRYSFVARVPQKVPDGEIGDPECGEFGDMPDGIQYFEVHPGARKVLFVRIGQDTPLFDEKTLTLLP